jgi:hypothetical protein
MELLVSPPSYGEIQGGSLKSGISQTGLSTSMLDKENEMYVRRYWYSRNGTLVTWGKDSPEERITLEMYKCYLEMLRAKATGDEIVDEEATELWSIGWRPSLEVEEFVKWSDTERKILWKELINLLDITVSRKGMFLFYCLWPMTNHSKGLMERNT